LSFFYSPVFFFRVQFFFGWAHGIKRVHSVLRLVCCKKDVAMCCSALQCVAVRCNVLQCVAVCCSVLLYVATCCRVLQCVAVCCSALQCVAVRCSALQYVATCSRALQCVVMCCSVLQRVAARSSTHLFFVSVIIWRVWCNFAYIVQFYVYLCTNVHICICEYIFMYVYIYLHTCWYIYYIYMPMYVFIIHTYVCIHNTHVTEDVCCPAKSRHFLRPLTSLICTNILKYMNALYACVYICMCTYYIYMCMYIQYNTNTHVTKEVCCPVKRSLSWSPWPHSYVPVYKYIYNYIFMYTHLYRNIYTIMCLCINTYKYIYMCTYTKYVCTCMYTLYIHMHVYIIRQWRTMCVVLQQAATSCNKLQQAATSRHFSRPVTSLICTNI